MFAKRSILAAGLGLLFLASGCGDDIDDARSVIEVAAVNEGGIFVIGMWDAGSDKLFPSEDDFRPAGHVPVTLRNRAYNEQIVSETFQPYGDFIITGVRVEWSPVAGSTSEAALSNLQRFNYDAQYDFMIPRGEAVTMNVMLAPFALKDDPYFADLASGYGGDGSTPSFSANAKMTFTGHDSGDDRLVSFEAYTIVEFIGVLISDDN